MKFDPVRNSYQTLSPLQPLQDSEIKLFQSFLPQLCKRTVNHEFAAIAKFMPDKFYIEEKIDGERIQLHKRGDEYFYCSRYGRFLFQK